MPSELKRKHRGAANELRAVLWLLNQGYEVFRNISQHGAIDIVAIHDDITLRLDVKQDQNSGQTRLRATEEQIKLGVLFLVALPNGNYEIRQPLPPQPDSKICAGCGKSFRTNRGKRFCGPACYHTWRREQNRVERPPKQSHSNPYKGIPRSPEVRAKISASKMGHPVSPETRAKLRAANLGKNRRRRPLKGQEGLEALAHTPGGEMAPHRGFCAVFSLIGDPR